MIPIGGHSMYSIWTRTARCRKAKYSTPTARRTSCAERRQVSQTDISQYIPCHRRLYGIYLRTDEFKQRLTKMKHGIIHCYTRVSWYCQKNEIKYENPNDLVLIGLWKKQFVFKLFAPENVEYIVIPDNTVLTDCFLCDSETDEVKYIK